MTVEQITIEQITKERDEALKYLKSFLWATIDPEDFGKDVELYEANPHITFIFMLKPDGFIVDRAITGGQIRRAMELVGYDNLKIAPAKDTIENELIDIRSKMFKLQERLREMDVMLSEILK